MKTLAKMLALTLVLAAGCPDPRIAFAEFRIPDNYRPLRYVATENQRQFEVTWPFEAKGDVHVKVSSDGGATFTDKVLDTDFTVTGAGTCTALNDCGGNIKFVANHCDDSDCAEAPCYCTADSIVIIYRDDAVDRTVNMTSITPEAVNLHLNRHTVQMQQTEDIAESRAVQVPIDNDYHNSEFSPVLPQVNASVVGHAIVVKPMHCDGDLESTCTTNGDCGTDQCLATGFDFSAFNLTDAPVTCPASPTMENSLLRWTSESCAPDDSLCVLDVPGSSLQCPVNLAAGGDVTAGDDVVATDDVVGADVFGNNSMESPIISAKQTSNADGGFIALYDTNGTGHSLSFQAGETMTQSIGLIWPAGPPTAGDALVADLVTGGGPYGVQLAWSAAAGGGDKPYHIHVDQTETPGAGSTFFHHIFSADVTCASDLAPSEARYFDGGGSGDTNVYPIFYATKADCDAYNFTQIGEVDFTGTAQTGTFSTVDHAPLAASKGDCLYVSQPDPMDIATNPVTMTIICTRN